MAHTINRRTLLVGTAAVGLRLLEPRWTRANGRPGEQAAPASGTGPVREFKRVSRKHYKAPFWDVQVDLLVTAPVGRRFRVPAFWSGGSVWRWRFWERTPGSYRFQTTASDTSNSDLHGMTGEFRIEQYSGANPLFRHGPLKVSANRRYLETADGRPFLWLGDTWWMGLTERLAWPAEFQRLAADGRDKGFNVVQLVAGLYPDMDSFDPRGKNEKQTKRTGIMRLYQHYWGLVVTW